MSDIIAKCVSYLLIKMSHITKTIQTNLFLKMVDRKDARNNRLWETHWVGYHCCHYPQRLNSPLQFREVYFQLRFLIHPLSKSNMPSFML